MTVTLTVDASLIEKARTIGKHCTKKRWLQKLCVNIFSAENKR